MLRWVVALVIPAVVAAAAFSWTLSGYFLYDDFVQGYLLRHDAPAAKANWSAILADFGSAQYGIEDWNYYRPLVSVWWATLFDRFGPDGVALHAFNVVVHALCCVGVAGVCGRN